MAAPLPRALPVLCLLFGCGGVDTAAQSAPLLGTCPVGAGPAHARASRASACGYPLQAVCAPSLGRSPCRGACAAGDPCRVDADCGGGGACLLEATGGVCVAACRPPTALLASQPDNCDGGTTCVAVGGSSAGYCLDDPNAPLDVTTFGARPSPHRSGQALQLALQVAESRGDPTSRVCLPAGTFDIERTLRVGDDTTLYGQGDATTLRRLDIVEDITTPGPCGARSDNLVLLMNRAYNCGNEGITLRDFRIDGSLAGVRHDDARQNPMVTIALSSVADTVVENLTIEHAPQDAIFVRNGGYDTAIRNNRILGFNEKWNNGGAINIEMQPGGALTPLGRPDDDARIANTEVRGNTVVMNAQRYCNDEARDFETHRRRCRGPIDCESGVCGDADEISLVQFITTDKYTATTTTATSAGWPAMRYPNPTVTDNILLSAADNAGAIRCIGCESTTITANCIAPHDGDPSAEAAACRSCLDTPSACRPPRVLPSEFEGIVVQSVDYWERPTAFQGIDIQHNLLVGSGDDKGIYVVTRDATTPDRDVTIASNRLLGWQADPTEGAFSAILVRGFDDVHVLDNEVRGPWDTTVLGGPVSQSLQAGASAISVEGRQVTGGATGLWVRRNDIRGFRTEVSRGALLVRGFEGPQARFEVRGNTFACLERGAAIRLGHVGEITRDGDVEVPTVSTVGCGTVTGAPPLTCQVTEGAVCGMTYPTGAGGLPLACLSDCP